MTDRGNPYRDEPVLEGDEAASDPDDAGPDGGQDVHLLATTPTRTRPNALDLERSPD